VRAPRSVALKYITECVLARFLVFFSQGRGHEHDSISSAEFDSAVFFFFLVTEAARRRSPQKDFSFEVCLSECCVEMVSTSRHARYCPEIAAGARGHGLWQRPRQRLGGARFFRVRSDSGCIVRHNVVSSCVT